jgi:sialate O-acetylesterase
MLEMSLGNVIDRMSRISGGIMFRKILIVLVLSAGGLRADVTPASLFSDHAVLQQGMSVPVWGRAAAGEDVTVTIGSQKQTAKADADGKWMVHLAELKASDDPVEMTIAGKNIITIKDVLVGEVWLGSGQSNMEFSVSKSVKRFAGVNDEAKEIAAANYPRLWMFTVKMRMTDTPQDDCEGEWQVCSPATVPGFSAVGYFFSRDLQKAIDRPVGFINSSYGASTAQAWISKDVLSADPQFAQSLARWSAAPAKLPATMPAVPTKRGTRGGPRNPHQDQHNPTLLWNAMIHPIEPYAIKGAVWYQGESITGSTAQFTALTETVITSWRKEWGEGDFPFYFVQLAALDNNSNKPEVREAQAELLKIPNTAMAVTIDIGDKSNVHPKDKQDLGDRLARIARANVYGEKIGFSGPMYESMAVDGDSIRVQFSHIGGGLVAKDGDLKTFVIAGKDGHFVPASAKIDGETVVVSSPEVPQPTAVRYAWNRWPVGCNLYNADGLPAAPFRSDAPANP